MPQPAFGPQDGSWRVWERCLHQRAGLHARRNSSARCGVAAVACSRDRSWICDFDTRCHRSPLTRDVSRSRYSCSAGETLRDGLTHPPPNCPRPSAAVAATHTSYSATHTSYSAGVNRTATVFTRSPRGPAGAGAAVGGGVSSSRGRRRRHHRNESDMTSSFRTK